jgi:hypothetical protein
VRVIEMQLAVPEGTLVLTPVYELTGYTTGGEATAVLFDPPARLFIRYNPQRLPENAFQPFVATYNDAFGLVRLNEPAGVLIETGIAAAQVKNESLFVVAVKEAPPAPPLPATFQASNLIIDPTESHIGETVSISITIANNGEVEGTYELHLMIDGIVRAIEEVTLTGASSQTFTFEVSNLAAGRHQVKIAGLSGDFEITRAEVSLPEKAYNWMLLDLIVGTVITLGAIAVFLFIRRAHRRRMIITDEDRVLFKDEE